MKKTITLSETELINMVKLMVEQVDLEAYDYLDFFDAFVSSFRKWLDENAGEDSKKYPFSVLTKKYGKDFLKEVFENEYEQFTRMYGDKIDRFTVERLVKKMVQKGKVSFISLRSDELFTEKYKRHIKYFIDRLGLPSWANLELVEEKPYSVKGILHINLPESIKSEQPTPRPNLVRKELVKNFEDLLGIDMGNPEFGGLQFDVTKVNNGEKEWVNKVLNKQIKKEIKGLPGAQNLHSIKVKIDSDVELHLVYKSESSWGFRDQFRANVRNYLKEKGYFKINVDY